MRSKEAIRIKLQAFIRKYYYNELIKGLILFLSLGMLYFLSTLFVEHILWLGSTPRALLFWSFIGVEILLFLRFILYPLFKLFRLINGLDENRASRMVGDFFPEVGDKLVNLLQLMKNPVQSELLVASIEQKSLDLEFVPFAKAVDFKKSLPYLKYAMIPLFILVIIFLSGESAMFSKSYGRIIHYGESFSPPAPFSFHIDRSKLTVRQSETLTIQVSTQGKVIPEEGRIHYQGTTYFLKKLSPGKFSYSFEPIEDSFEFRLSANEVISAPYNVEVVRVPKVRQLEMSLDYPSHTGMADEMVQGIGNATVPVGTRIMWKLTTVSTDKVSFRFLDSVYVAMSDGNEFEFKRVIHESQRYQISTSNEEVSDFENLNYSIRSIRDGFPEIEVAHKVDSTDSGRHYFGGRAIDDYGIGWLNMVVQSLEEPDKKFVRRLETNSGLVAEFFAEYPDTLAIKRGEEYEVFFELYDNDEVNGPKKTKSKSFFFRKKTADEEKSEILEMQSGYIDEMRNSLEERAREEVGAETPEFGEGAYFKQEYLERDLEERINRNERMKSLMNKFQDNLGKDENSYNDSLRSELRNRVDRTQIELEKQEDLLKELEEYAERIESEGLQDSLKELDRKSQVTERNLEQLLELTKKYYVREKLSQLAHRMEDLGEKQEDISNIDEIRERNIQDSINRASGEMFQELEKLSNENGELVDPVSLGRDKQKESEIKEDQQDAMEHLKEGKVDKAAEKQGKAGKELKSLAGKMLESVNSNGMEMMVEDIESLRNIVDNLIVFSFKQEELMKEFQNFGGDDPSFSFKLKEQHALKENFEHIDDSIYVVGLRNSQITENINELLMDVSYNLEIVLDRFAGNQITQAIGGQQYVMSGANELALFLSDKLQQLEKMMSRQMVGKGNGGGDGVQLSDIIEKQGELREKVLEELERKRQKGQDGKGSGGLSEEESERLYQIFQEQQMIRRELRENEHRDGRNKKAEVLREMENVEKELLKGGVDSKIFRRMEQLEQRLLEMKDANLNQGRESSRTSKVSEKEFINTAEKPVLKAKEYFSTSEILNRQALPLRQIYKLKVIEYFGRRDN